MILASERSGFILVKVMRPEILTYWCFNDGSWGRLIPEAELWTCDAFFHRLPEYGTPVPKHVEGGTYGLYFMVHNLLYFIMSICCLTV